MPLYTYVMAHKGRIAVHQLRKSNPKGWIAEAVAASFPGLGKAASAAILRMEVVPVPGLVGVWSAGLVVDGGDLVVRVVETRG